MQDTGEESVESNHRRAADGGMASPAWAIIEQNRILKSSNPILYRLRVGPMLYNNCIIIIIIELKKIQIELIFFQRLTPSDDVGGRYCKQDITNNNN